MANDLLHRPKLPGDEHAQSLHVFERTPSSVDARDNSVTDAEWAASLKPGWRWITSWRTGARQAISLAST
jgi:hypothetical protein